MSDGANTKGSDEQQRQTGTFIANVVSLHIATCSITELLDVQGVTKPTR